MGFCSHIHFQIRGPKVHKWAFPFWRVYCGVHLIFNVVFFNDFLRKISLSETLRHYYYYVTITIFDIREEFQILIYIFFYFPSNFNIVFFVQNDHLYGLFMNLKKNWFFIWKNGPNFFDIYGHYDRTMI